MDEFNYHSGSGTAFIGERSAAIQQRVATFSLAAPSALRKIRFVTDKYAPNHNVTIRSEIDGWQADRVGTYRNGSWEFFFDLEGLPQTLIFKFVLDGQWMIGPDLTVPTNADQEFAEAQISFPVVEPKFQHGYDNFHVDYTKDAQEAAPRNTREDIEYDVIIIGSGIGGGTLADALADADVKVLVLEAGSLRLPTHITNLPGDWTRVAGHHAVGHFDNEPGSDFLPGVHLSLGGRSNYWSGLIPQMRHWELDQWPDEIQDFFQNQNGYEPAERLLRKRRTLGQFQDQVVQKLSADLGGWFVEDVPRSRHQPFVAEDGDPANILQSSTGVFSASDLLLTSLSFPGRAGRQNLTINTGHLVTHIETSGRNATGVVCQDLIGNTTRKYRGKSIVLAAGSLESARIALQSGLSDPNGKIGIGLTDHPAFFSAQYTVPSGSPFAGNDKHAKVFLQKENATFDDHPFNVEVLINPVHWHVRNSDDDLRPQPGVTKMEMKFVFASLLDDDNHVLSPGVGKKLSVKVKRNGAGIPHFGDAQAARNLILQSLGVPFTANEGMGYGNEGTVHHAGGSLRMSGDGSGVVDTQLRFEAYDNLYCADPSVWPMIPAANPVLTLVALTQRLASSLQQLV